MNLGRWLQYNVTGSKTMSPRRRKKNHPRGPARDHGYRAFVRTFPCCACGRVEEIEAAHTGHDGGMAQKSSDYSCAPLCPSCHREYDNGMRSKGLFEKDWGIDMDRIVRDLNRLYAEDRRVS